MIDLGLTKLAVIGAVALVVIGPEKLPTVARMAGTLYGRAQRYLSDVKSEVSRELEASELGNLHQAALAGANGIQAEVASLKAGVESAVTLHPDVDDTPWRGDLLASLAPNNPNTDDGRKAREFRRNKLARTAGVPTWYKNRQGRRQHTRSSAARDARRAGVESNTSFF
jgi:sec-independent protein translocase protein TatB